jgi:hypothetical protein
MLRDEEALEPVIARGTHPNFEVGRDRGGGSSESRTQRKLGGIGARIHFARKTELV